MRLSPVPRPPYPIPPATDPSGSRLPHLHKGHVRLGVHCAIDAAEEETGLTVAECGLDILPAHVRAELAKHTRRTA